MTTRKQTGFTIVELLIVIVVIGILAAITIVAYNGIQDRARKAKINQDIVTIKKAVIAARQTTNKTFGGVTGSYATGGTCWSKADGTDLATLTSSDPCIANYTTAMNSLQATTGANLANLRDPWGRPYLIDENEGEGGGCSKDTVAVYKLPFTTGFGAYSATPTYDIPLSGVSGC